MSQVGKLAMLLDAFPVVQNNTDRDTKYPSPDTNFRVHNLATGYVEQYDGANWVPAIASEKGGRVFNVKAYGAKGDGSQDDTAFVGDAIAAAKAVRGRVHFPHGQYRVTASIITAANAAASFTGITFSGESGSWGYDGAVLSSVLVADANFANGTAVLDLRYTNQTAVRDLAIDMSACVNQVTGIEYGDRAQLAFYSNHHVEGCTIHHGDKGIRANNAGLLRIRNNNISAHTSAGISLDSFAGDSDIEGNYVNTCAGIGIYVGQGSANINIRGGKVEYNGKGIHCYDTQGVTVTGINFDTNNYYHVGVECDVTTINYQPRSISIVNNRFLGGGTLDGGGVFGKAHIAFNIGSADMRLTVVGNTFRKGGTGAYDLNTTGTVGPMDACIRGAATVGVGTFTINSAGNDYADGSTTFTFDLTGGAGCVLYDMGSVRNLSNQTSGAGIQLRIQAVQGVSALTDGATVLPDPTKGDYFTLSAGGSRTIANPATPVNGQTMTFEILNNTVGAITTTWSSLFALAGAWTDPAAGKRRTITFRFNATLNKLVEQGRSAADI